MKTKTETEKGKVTGPRREARTVNDTRNCVKVLKGRHRRTRISDGISL